MVKLWFFPVFIKLRPCFSGYGPLKVLDKRSAVQGRSDAASTSQAEKQMKGTKKKKWNSAEQDKSHFMESWSVGEDYKMGGLGPFESFLGESWG